MEEVKPFTDKEIKKFETPDGWEEVIMKVGRGYVGSMRNRFRATIIADLKRIEKLEEQIFDMGGIVRPNPKVKP